MTKSGFEAEWRSRTMHRYGVLAVIANLSLLFALLAFLLLPLLWVRRRRDRGRMRELRKAEVASENASRASALDAILASALVAPHVLPPPSGSDGSTRSDQST
jgi:hypothetical protein